MVRGSSSCWSRGVITIPQAAGNRDAGCGNRDAGCGMRDAGGVLGVVRDWDGQGSTLRRPYIPQVIG